MSRLTRRPVKSAIKVADEVWIATALLHREHRNRTDFTVDEIVERASRERLTSELRPGVRVHANLHCVANVRPNPGRYRMLYATGKSRRRLFRQGDAYDPARRGSKITPSRHDLPREYWELLDWYERAYAAPRLEANTPDPLLDLRGSGKRLWADEHADDYVRRLRRGWQ